MLKRILAVFLVGVAGVAGAGDVYKWQDEKGLWHFSDKPPPEEQASETLKTPVTRRTMVEERRGGLEHEPEHYFTNLYSGPAQLNVRMENARNVQTDPPLPADFEMPARKEMKLLSVRAADPNQGFAYRLSYQLVPGPVVQDVPQNLDYYPPFAAGESWPISQGLDDSNTHNDSANRYAVDIAMPVGTPVLAARGGLVMDFEDDFHGDGKQEEKYKPRANYVRVLHDDGSMAVYAHLQSNSARVRPGQRIKTGRWIANSGNTGFSSGPHLHFVVQMNVGMAIESLPFHFRLPAGGVMDPDRPQVLEGVLPGPG